MGLTPCGHVLVLNKGQPLREREPKKERIRRVLKHIQLVRVHQKVRALLGDNSKQRELEAFKEAFKSTDVRSGQLVDVDVDQSQTADVGHAFIVSVFCPGWRECRHIRNGRRRTQKPDLELCARLGVAKSRWGCRSRHWVCAARRAWCRPAEQQTRGTRHARVVLAGSRCDVALS